MLQVKMTPIAPAVSKVLFEHFKPNTTRYQWTRYVYDDFMAMFPGICLETISKVHVQAWVDQCREAENRPGTLNAKMSALNTLFKHNGVVMPFAMPWATPEREPKWWLTPEMEREVLTYFRARGDDEMCDYIRWTVLTGLRVEETLRTQKFHFTGLQTDRPTLTVPGTKTGTSQRALPLFPDAANIATRRLHTGRPHDALLFPTPYWSLRDRWFVCRKALMITDRLATLKSFRRSFAKQTTDRGLPSDMLRQALGHSRLTTTEEYLRVVGGYNTEILRQWFR